MCTCCTSRAPSTVVIRMALDAEGLIDPGIHETGVVFPGDRIQWTYSGNRNDVRLTVTDFAVIADLGRLSDLGGDELDRPDTALRKGGGPPTQTWGIGSLEHQKDPLHGTVDSIKPVPAGDLVRAKSALRHPDKPPPGILDEVRLAPHLHPRGSREDPDFTDPEWELWPFSAGWLPPEDPVAPNDQRLTSTPIKYFRGHWLWKFLWVVQVGGEPTSTSCPHIFMHEPSY